jgi:hypothetical protein
MKKISKTILNLIIAGIVSAISYIGFRKGIETIEEKLDKDLKK